tara:strand:+ start:781 stop:993 length:213 start_codon:yes stop_codon:yes gene_type:complete
MWSYDPYIVYMNQLLDKIAKKRRCLSHKLYIKSVMADIQNDIAKEAITTGKVDLSKRKLFLKYKNYYEKL